MLRGFSMACNKPFLRYVSARHNPLGYDVAIPTPCGHCAGCLRDYITSWSDRCTFEAQTQKRPSSFVTLTYNDDHLPFRWKRFQKRLRKLQQTFALLFILLFKRSNKS